MATQQATIQLVDYIERLRLQLENAGITPLAPSTTVSELIEQHTPLRAYRNRRRSSTSTAFLQVRSNE